MAWAIVDIWSGHISGQWVYPKNRRVVYPSVFDAKSNGAPDVSVSVNFGFGRGGETSPPRYVDSALPAGAGSGVFFGA